MSVYTKNILNVFLVLFSVYNLSFAGVTEIRALSELAARKQFEHYAMTYEIVDYGDSVNYNFLKEAEIAYINLLDHIFANYDSGSFSSIDSKPSVGAALVQTIAFMQTRAHLTGQKLDRLGSHSLGKLFRHAEHHAGNDPVFRYLKYFHSIKDSSTLEESIAYLNEVYDSADRKFPECANELVSLTRKSKDIEESRLLDKDFLRTLDHYHPVLNNFDYGYPMKPHHFYYSSDFTLSREVYEARKSPKRFIFTLK